MITGGEARGCVQAGQQTARLRDEEVCIRLGPLAGEAEVGAAAAAVASMCA